jgi:Big-like domain-containing protein
MKNQVRLVVTRTALALAVASLLAVAACDDVPQLAPPAATMTVFATPTSVAASGGISVITAIVTEAAGTPVPDGTVIQFFTNLGTIDREGKTLDGVARVNFISDARSGEAAITAVSGPITGTTSVSIGNVVASQMILIADPPFIRLSLSKTTHIIATVLDGNGNPVPNIGVIFTVNSTTETMEPGGTPVFTDNNGRAEAVLRTKRTTPGSATVQVQTLGGITKSITVQIVQ